MSTRDTGGDNTELDKSCGCIVLYPLPALCIVGKLILHFSFSESDIFPARALCVEAC